MTILSNDIKIYQAQDNTDNDSGGGSRTSTEIKDGNVNNLFPDISRIDTVSGDVALRKIFPAVITLNRDVYYGAHSIIRKRPNDPNVSALIYHTDDPHDKRINARDSIESYLVASYIEQFYLFGNHVQGSRSVTWLQTFTSPLPLIGEVYLLIDPSGFEQYIRTVDVDVSNIILSYNDGSSITDHARRRIICEIEQALEFSFVGSAFNPVGQLPNTTTTYATQIADAAKFYGTRPLADDALVGDNSISVDTIYESLVPSSKAQEPLINQVALGDGFGVISSNKITNLSLIIPAGSWFGSLNIGVTPGSLTFSGHHDDAEGNIINNITELTVATIDYSTGDINNGTGGINVSGTQVFNFEAATGSSSPLQFTGGIKVTSGNQGFFFNKTLTPLPSPGQIYVDYRSQNKWYRINPYSIEPSIGSFTVNDNYDGTGTILVTLGSLPDMDSTIIISWGSLEKLYNRTSEVNPFYLSIDLADRNINPITFTMLAKGQTITSDANGVLSDTDGTITGKLDVSNGEVIISGCQYADRFDAPGSVNDVVIDYNYAEPGVGEPGEINSANIPEANFVSVNRTTGAYSFNIGETVEIGSVQLIFPVNYWSNYFYGSWNTNASRTIVLNSDNTGSLIDRWGNSWGSVAASGLVTMTNRNITIKGFGVVIPPGLGSTNPRYVTISAKTKMVPNFTMNVVYKIGLPATYPLIRNYTDKMENLSKYIINTEGFVAGEVAFRMIVDTNNVLHNFYSKNGLILQRTDITTSLQVGTINYDDGIIEMSYLHDPDLFFLEFFSLATNESGDEDQRSVDFTFKTSATRIVPSSLQLRYNTVAAPTVTEIASTDQNGVITGAGIDAATSYVDAETGMVYLEFTAEIFPASFTYDAIAEKSLPVDPELLGLNPIRLPIDGRVPVFEYGRHLVIFDEATTSVVGGTPVAGQQDTLARSGQSYIEVIDSLGKRLDPVQYVADRAAGTVTFGNPLTLEDKYGVPLTGPYSIVDRIEDMVQAADVQINGDIALSAALTHNYTALNSLVASALVWGDTGSRVFNIFAQEIWDNGNPVWSDNRIGDPTTAQYDDVNYPIQIDNKSSTSGRWAIIFTGSRAVSVVEEVLGVLATNVNLDLIDVAPINPATGSPYFTIPRVGFGSGWVTNNVVRFNTDSGDQNMWVIRIVQAGALSELTDNIEIEIRGDAN